MNRQIRSIEYIHLPTDEESILYSHWLTYSTETILIWGSLNDTYEDWKARRTPEQIAEVVAKGFDTRGLTFCQTGKLSDLIGKKEDNESRT